jgi:hypothetical protein
VVDDELRLPKRYYVVGDEVVLRIELNEMRLGGLALRAAARRRLANSADVN